jgi:hypothetical protein
MGYWPGAIGKSYSIRRRFPPRNQVAAAAEFEFQLCTRLHRAAGHVLFFEEHLQFLHPSTEASRWIGTIHLPRRCWKASDLEPLSTLQNVIVLCNSMRDQFENVVGRSKIRVLPYGVAAEFFSPDLEASETKASTLLYVGVRLRNAAVLAGLAALAMAAAGGDDANRIRRRPACRPLSSASRARCVGVAHGGCGDRVDGKTRTTGAYCRER